MIVHGILHSDLTVRPYKPWYFTTFARRLGFVHL